MQWAVHAKPPARHFDADLLRSSQVRNHTLCVAETRVNCHPAAPL